MWFSICNEVFEQWTWADTVRIIAGAGYDGVEIAPYTLADSVNEISPAERAALRSQAADVGLEIAGLTGRRRSEVGTIGSSCARTTLQLLCLS